MTLILVCLMSGANAEPRLCLLTAAGADAVLADDAAQQYKLDLQERCAAQAKKEFDAEGYIEEKANSEKGFDTYESHYSPVRPH